MELTAVIYFHPYWSNVIIRSHTPTLKLPPHTNIRNTLKVYQLPNVKFSPYQRPDYELTTYSLYRNSLYSLGNRIGFS